MYIILKLPNLFLFLFGVCAFPYVFAYKLTQLLLLLLSCFNVFCFYPFESENEVGDLSESYDLCIGGDCMEMLQQSSSTLKVIPYVKVQLMAVYLWLSLNALLLLVLTKKVSTFS